MLVSSVLLLAVGLVVVFLCRLFFVVRYAVRSPQRDAVKGRPLNVVVVLGSGGHTSEMFLHLSQLPKESWLSVRPVYVLSNTDKDSAGVATAFEAKNRRAARVVAIPRAREVGQSYATSIVSTLVAAVSCVRLVLRERPDALLTNGPGVCIPVVAVAIVLAALGICHFPCILYFESFTCVDHVSLSGKLMIWVSDVFAVQWPELFAVLARHNNVRHCGPFTTVDRTAPLPLVRRATPEVPNNGCAAPYAVVTVGSTYFDELMEAIDNPAFFAALAAPPLNIRHVLIQFGRSKYVFRAPSAENEVSVAGGKVSVELVGYKPHLADTIRGAAVLISHAGAGTILEAMRSKTPTIVVPNERLMSNHQIRVASALAERHHLFCVLAQDIKTTLPSLRWDTLREFPPVNQAAITSVISVALGLPR